jgi:hypothetical protein
MPHHGKEGVDGSNPSEGLKKRPANGHFVLPGVARFRLVAGTRRVHFGTSGHAQARATVRGIPRSVLHCKRSLDKFPANRELALPALAQTLTPSFAKRASLALVGERTEA